MAMDRDTTTAWMRDFGAQVSEHRQELSELDAAIGDGDHGSNMERGMTAALAKLDDAEPADAGAVLTTVAMTLVSTVGGAAGPLYGTLLLAMGKSLAGDDVIELAGFAEALRAGIDGVRQRGKAEVGDKTMLDALVPALDALEATTDFAEGLTMAAGAAASGARGTTEMIARRGRASYLGERSAGHQDPGATSSSYLIAGAARTLAG